MLEATGYASALRHRDVRFILGGLVVSATGSWAYNVALLVFVFDRTQSLAWVGAATLGRFLPALAFSAYGGVIAERFERVRVMIASDLLCMGLQVGLAVVAAMEGSVTLAIALAGLTAVANIVYNPSVAAMLPQVAGEDDLAAANALNGTIEQLTVITGPAIGAVLVGLGSVELAFAVNAASFGASALLVSRVHARSKAVDVTEGGELGPLRQMVVGAKTIAAEPAARVLVAFCALVSFVYGTDTVLFVAASDEKLGTGPNGYGYLMVGLGIGGVLMASTVNKLASSPRLAFVIMLGLVGYCLPTAALTVVHEPVVAFLLQIVRGGSTLIVDVLAVIALQRSVPPDTLARVFGVFFAFVLAAISLGALIMPPIVNAFGLDAALVIAAVGPITLGLAGLPELVRLDRRAAAELAELEPRIAVLQRIGIFAAAGRPTLERLARAATEVTVPPGEVIVREGDPPDALYVIADGEVGVTSKGETGDEYWIRTMLAGTYFGEIGLIERIPRTATVTAAKETRLVRVDGDAFLDVLTSVPPSSSFVEGARQRLARTHPSLRPTYEPEPAAG